jgi:hypothetical protein
MKAFAWVGGLYVAALAYLWWRLEDWWPVATMTDEDFERYCEYVQVTADRRGDA